MGRNRLSSFHVVELLVVAIVGGALALGGAALFGKLGDRTTIQQMTPHRHRGNGTAPARRPARGSPRSRSTGATRPGVVQITATTVAQPQGQQVDPFGNILPVTPQSEQSLGSGFVIDKAGHIVTNFHVIQGAQKVQVSFSGQDEIRATVVGKDPSTDIAVLKIDAHARALTPLALGDSDAVTVGDSVYAIGNPFGFTRTLTTGVVSAVQRQIEAPNTLPIDHAIQTDAAINHGNSGGPLIDAAGRVIGVTSQISTGSTGGQGNVGIGFAIPVNTVRTVASQIISTGKVEHAFLGLGALPVSQSSRSSSTCRRITASSCKTCRQGSGADKAGLVAGKTAVVVQGESYQVGGDIIVSIDGEKLTEYEQLRDAITRHKPGDKVHLEIYRGGKKKSVTATLGVRPNIK